MPQIYHVNNHNDELYEKYYRNSEGKWQLLLLLKISLAAYPSSVLSAPVTSTSAFELPDTSAPADFDRLSFPQTRLTGCNKQQNNSQTADLNCHITTTSTSIFFSSNLHCNIVIYCNKKYTWAAASCLRKTSSNVKHSPTSIFLYSSCL